ncbi:ureidoglycolate hydrolase [Sorangium cellulosum]|jgi:ureidoglycolate lyase|uniref:Ureidoglycolate hydrolase n=1 Tax=Sorangium cellulosum TaxID=56 RepID=A0A4P2PUD0_SORCE|nr:ureidoglycolate lyase [Sorangium cellulosum]AUX19983.1 ureidoglycolate hydrolase [Sorangium cellulosum]
MSHRQRIVAHALSPAAYAPYGDVLMASPHGQPGRPANQGTARRFDHLAGLEDLRPGRAALNLSVFRCAPRSTSPFPIALLEKHPGSTQAFVPMNARRYLVIVALGGARPDLTTLAAFIARGAQGVTYRPGVWHHPMIALDAETDFVCLAWEDGSAGDCVVVEYEERERIAVEIAP